MTNHPWYSMMGEFTRQTSLGQSPSAASIREFGSGWVGRTQLSGARDSENMTSG